MIDFCNDCFSIPSCPCPNDVCTQVRIAGVVNRTDISVPTDSGSTDDAQDAILYCWRLSIENCSNTTFCDVQVRLEPRFKTTGTIPRCGGQDIFNPEVIVATTAGNISDENTAVTNVSANITGAETVAAGAWDQAAPELFAAPGTLPPGRWVLEVCAEIRKSALEEYDCPDPALFPSIFSVTGHTPSNVGCPLNVCTFVGCSPDSVVATLGEGCGK